MAAMALERGETIWPLYVKQGFIWEDEEIAATQRFLENLPREFAPQAQGLTVGRVEAPKGHASRWAFDEDVEAPGAQSPDEAVYLPGRNLSLLTQGALLANSVGVVRLQLGLLAGNPFSDSTPEFLRSFEATADAAMGRRLRVETPLSHLTKMEVLMRGIRFDLSETLSCIRPRGGEHCGACNKCAERLLAFKRAGLNDPARYARKAAAPL
jgi:7-cyano-7-deazaguanine synthase